jgi:D-alanine-D-alanine ligase
VRVALTYNLRRTTHEAEAEFDSAETIDALTALVAGLGHQVVPIEVSGPVARLLGELGAARPDVVFNLAEGERGAFREAFYPALFEHVGLPHTGSSASALALCLDKALAKRVVAASGVPVAESVLIRCLDDLAGLSLPVIVKPNFEGSSKGITLASIVTRRERLEPVVRELLHRYPGGVLIETYVDGVDVAVGWVDGFGLLAPIAYRYAPQGRFRILDYALKQAADLVTVEVPARIARARAERLLGAAARAFKALGVTGYGRADFRLGSRGEVVFLEMNPLPTLAPTDPDLYAAARCMGKTPSDLVARILASARAS